MTVSVLTALFCAYGSAVAFRLFWCGAWDLFEPKKSIADFALTLLGALVAGPFVAAVHPLYLAWLLGQYIKRTHTRI